MKLIAVLSAALLLLAAPVLANNQFVKCVQNQLAAKNLDPGPIDGLVGSKTRNALKQLAKSTPQLKGLPKLTKRFAVTWCRAIGKTDPVLREYYPNFGKSHVIYSDKQDHKELDIRLKTNLSEILPWYRKKIGVERVSTLVLIFATSGRSAVKMTLQAQKRFWFPQQQFGLHPAQM